MEAMNLPKWPQMYTTGKPVTPEQALEIILRTDSFFSSPMSGGNALDWNARVQRALGLPTEEDRPEYLSDKATAKEREAFRQASKAYWDAYTEFQEAIGWISTSYVGNSWVSCSFIGGPHGWMHPDGQIGYVDNVGKWPNVEAIVDDWKKIAEAFPFLEIDVTLMDREDLEDGKTPLFGIRVRGKEITWDKADGRLHMVHAPATRRGGRTKSMEEQAHAVMFKSAEEREVGLPFSVIEAWAKRVRR